jgi:4-hydroxybenzoate polyprenyltransferase
MSRLRSLLATLRIANAPSVVSNVWLGFMLGRQMWGGIWSVGAPFPWLTALALSVSGLLLYFAGNLANDWFDREWDQIRRPERALPSGLFAPRTYLVASLLLAVSGIAVSFAVAPASGGCAIAIVALIALYTRFHKQAIWAVIPMGLCRAGLYFLGALVFWPGVSEEPSLSLFQLGWLATLGLGLFSYIAGLSLSARYEGMADAPYGPRVISKALLMVPLLAMTCFFVPAWPVPGIAGMIPFAIWLTLCLTTFRKPIPRYVSALLAGIPLVDFIAACPLAFGTPVDIFGGASAIGKFPAMIALLVVPLAAFVLGRALQKLAPAT